MLVYSDLEVSESKGSKLTWNDSKLAKSPIGKQQQIRLKIDNSA